MPAPPTRTPNRRPGSPRAGGNEDYGEEYSSLNYQTEQQHKTMDSRAFKDIFDPDKVRDITFFKPNQGPNFIDIIPFPVGPRHPEVCVRKKMKEGMRAYVLEVWRHGNIGPNDDQYICLARTYNKPCPICEFRQTEEPGADAKELTPKRRSVFCVWDRKAEDKGLQIWEVAHFFMDKPLQARVVNPKTGAKVNFSHPSKTEGKHISFDLAIKGINREYTGHQFVDRDEGIPKWILDQAPVLDDLLFVPTYEEVEEAFYSSGGETQQPDGQQEQYQQEYDQEHAETLAGQDTGPYPTCPYGGVIGADYMAFNECDNCQVATVCADLAPPEEVQQPEPPTAPPQPTRRAVANPAPAAVEQPAPASAPAQRPRPLRRQQ